MNEQNNVREHMEVIGSCGTRLGLVDRVENGAIKLTRDSGGDGQHHFIPMDWVDHVDRHVHLKMDCGEAKKQWRSAPMATGA